MHVTLSCNLVVFFFFWVVDRKNLKPQEISIVESQFES